jgi:hypothetical protein
MMLNGIDGSWADAATKAQWAAAWPAEFDALGEAAGGCDQRRNRTGHPPGMECRGPRIRGRKQTIGCRAARFCQLP